MLLFSIHRKEQVLAQNLGFENKELEEQDN